MEASSAINAPHPDDAGEDLDVIFGAGESEADRRAAEGAAYAEETAAEERTTTTPAPGATEEGKAALAELRERQEEEPDPTPAEGDGTTGSTTEDPTPASSGASQPEEDAPAITTEKASGSAEREYIVLQRIALTERVLRHLLDQLDSGEIAEPRLAYFELRRVTARNDKLAISAAYREHRAALGERCDLAAVSARSFKERQVRPRPRSMEETLEII